MPRRRLNPQTATEHDPYNKVIWSEGLFLRPQHLQQQERYLERYMELHAGALRPHAWGFSVLELEPELLSIGKLGIRRARGCFPDGTPFSIPIAIRHRRRWTCRPTAATRW